MKNVILSIFFIEPAESHQPKPQKSVSFEDNEAEEKEKTIEFVIPSFKRSKYGQPPIRQNAVSQSPPPQRSLSPVQVKIKKKYGKLQCPIK